MLLNKKSKSLKIIPAIFIFVLSIAASFRKMGADTAAYKEIYNEAYKFDFDEINVFGLFYNLDIGSVEILYYLANYSLNSVGLTYHFLFFILIAILLGSFLFVSQKCFGPKYGYICMIIFTSSYVFHQLGFNQIRQGASISFYMVAMHYVSNSKRGAFIINWLPSILLHVTSFFTLFFALLAKIRFSLFRFIFAIFLGLVFFNFPVAHYAIQYLGDYPTIFSRVTNYLNYFEYSRGIDITFTFLVSIFFLCIAAYPISRLTKDTTAENVKFHASIVFYGSILLFLFVDFQIIYQRISYFVEIFYPFIIVHLFKSIKPNIIIGLFLSVGVYAWYIKTLIFSWTPHPSL
jgi:hypothetical protein